MPFKSVLFCDRRVYDKRGKWQSPNKDYTDNIFYFVKEPLTLTPSWENGRETIKTSMTITVFGGKPFAKEDVVELEDGSKLKVQTIQVNYLETNILVKDLLKPIVESITLELE